jgi:hypothetical protein
MKPYVKAALIITGAHLVRCVSDYYYYFYCAGLFNSMFSWGSPTCRGLRWVSDTTSFGIIGTVQNIVAKALPLLT